MERELVPRAEAAKILGVTPQTVSNYVRRGWLTSVIRNGEGRTHFYVFRDEVNIRRGLIKDIADAETRLNETRLEISRNQAEADTLLKESVEAVFGARRSKALLGRLLALVQVLIDKTARTVPSFTETDKNVLMALLFTADIKKVCVEQGISEEGVKMRVHRAVAKLARAKDVHDIADERRICIDELEKENAQLRIALAKIAKTASVDEFLPPDVTVNDIRKKLFLGIGTVGLSRRVVNCCKAMDVYTVGELVRYSRSEVRAFRNLGKKSLCEMDAVLRDLGLTYGMDAAAYGVPVSRKRV